MGKGCRVMAGGQAAIAQLVARGSHNPKVVSSILTGRIFRSSSFFQLWDHFFHSPVELENKIHLFFQLLDHFFQLTLRWWDLVFQLIFFSSCGLFVLAGLAQALCRALAGVSEARAVAPSPVSSTGQASIAQLVRA